MINAQLDQLSWQILAELQADAGLSYAEIGRRVGLSTPAAAARVRRLEESGVISGYSAQINPSRLGLTVAASSIYASAAARPKPNASRP